MCMIFFKYLLRTYKSSHNNVKPNSLQIEPSYSATDLIIFLEPKLILFSEKLIQFNFYLREILYDYNFYNSDDM